MEITAGKFIYCEAQAESCTFSFKGAAFVPACDFFMLPVPKYQVGECFTLDAADCGRWEVVTSRVCTLAITIVDEVYRVIRQAVCQVANTCRKFACSNLCRGRRVAPMVPMALRL